MPQITSSVHIKAHAVISRAIEDGLNYGWNRVWKHREGPITASAGPEAEDAKETLLNEIMNALDEVVCFDTDCECR